MMYTLPLRLTLLQFGHIFLTDDRTFMPRMCDGITDVEVVERMVGRSRVGCRTWRGWIGRNRRNGRIREKNMIVIDTGDR
jgi:hypothetical protein